MHQLTAHDLTWSALFSKKIVLPVALSVTLMLYQQLGTFIIFRLLIT